MIVFKNLSVRNFLSFGNNIQNIDLTKNTMTLIQGMNIDKGDEDGNKSGAGKTTILQALHFVLFGKSINNAIKKTNLINKINKKHLEVSIDFEKDGIEYRIERGRSPEYLRFFVDNKETNNDEAQGENSKTQEEINKVLGFDEDIFCQTIILTSSVTSFFNKSLADQRTTIEQLLGISLLSDKADTLKSKLKEVKQVISNEEIRINTIKSANEQIIESHNKQENILKEKIAEYDMNKTNKISELKNAIKKLNEVDIEKELLAFKNNELRENIIKSNNEKFSKISELKNDLMKLNLELEQLNNFKKEDIDLEYEISKHNEKKEQELFKSENSKKLLELTNQLNSKTNEFNALCNEKNSKKNTLQNENKLSISSLQISETQLNNELKDIEKEIDETKTFLSKIEEGICPTCGQKIHDFNKKEEYNKKLEELKNRFYTTNDNITQNQKAVKDIDIKEKIELEKIENEYDGKIKIVSEELEKIKWEHGELKITLETLPVIETTFESLDKVYEYKNQLEQLDIKKENVSNNINSINKQLEELKLEDIPEKVETFYNSIEEVEKHKQSLLVLQNTLDMTEKEENPFIKQLNEHQKSLKLMEIDDSLLKLSKDDEKHLDLLIKLLVNKDSFIRRKIIEQNLNYLNARLKQYLKDINILHTITFNSDMSIDISKQGENFDFANLSQGEKTAVILALNFSFRDLYELINSPTNLLMIDELIDLGLDSIMAKNVLKIIGNNTKNKNIFVISHRPDIQNYFDNTIVATMERGFTNIEYM